MRRHVPLGDFRHLIIDEALRRLRLACARIQASANNGFLQRDPSGLMVPRTTAELLAAVVDLAGTPAANVADLASVTKESVDIARSAVAASDGALLLGLWKRLMDLHGVADHGSADGFVVEKRGIEIQVGALEVGDDELGVPQWAMQRDRDDQQFVAAVANMIAEVRRRGRTMTRDECVAVAAAYRLLERGVRLPPSYASMGLSGFRRHQTCLSIANPGEGHIAVTAKATDLLDGVIVHIEHIDRDGERDRERVEPYRIPSLLDAARVRLHVGSAAPCSVYVGRPMFDGGLRVWDGGPCPDGLCASAFELDLLKSVHAVAASCSAMFAIGVAECKIAVERMSVQGAIRFLRAVSANTIRNRLRQILSAAFNLYLPLRDDRTDPPRWLATPYEIANAGVEIAAEAGFGKVTWDGAGSALPSKPVIQILSAGQWIDLVHLSHERGLETYASAGLQSSDVAQCVAVGFDAIGIGTSLHHRDPHTHAIGQLRADSMCQALRQRDRAEQSTLGLGARLLARLDRLAFEGTLAAAIDERRRELHLAVRAQDEGHVSRLVASSGPRDWTDRDEPSIVQQARRVIESADSHPVGADRMGEEAWRARVRAVSRMLESRDLTGLAELLS